MQVRNWTQDIMFKHMGIALLALLAALMYLTRRVDWYGFGLDTADSTGRMQS